MRAHESRRRQPKTGQKYEPGFTAIGRDMTATMPVPALDWPSDLFADVPAIADDSDCIVILYRHPARGIAQAGVAT
jgi:hypothetical protein